MAGQKPKYMILVDWVKEQIDTGKLSPGQKLNSENELVLMFQISRQTVRHGISILEKEGIIERKRGSGTYINNFFKRERSGNTMNIAVVTTYVDDYIFPNIIQAIEKVVSDAGYTIQLAFTHNSVEKERAVLKNLLDKNMVDGLIVETTKSGLPNPNQDLYAEIVNRKIPGIFFNSYYPGIDLPHVALDDHHTGRLCTEYLLAHGHRKIAAVLKCDDGQGHMRYAGYIEALNAKGIRVQDEHIIWLDTEDINHMQTINRKIIRRLRDCTACLCYNDEVAEALITILKKGGIRVPEQMSLISIDNSELADKCEVPLTSVVHPGKELGEKAAENLLCMIQEDSFDGNYEFKPELKVRNSVVSYHNNQNPEGEL